MYISPPLGARGGRLLIFSRWLGAYKSKAIAIDIGLTLLGPGRII